MTSCRWLLPLLVFGAGVTAAACSRPRAELAARAAAATAQAKEAAPSQASPDQASPDRFQGVIQPLLATQCAPCHLPGGKMYAELPFDNPGVVRSHKEGVLKRLKSQDDKQLVEAWIDAPGG